MTTVKVSKNELAKLVRTAGRITPAKSATPILTMFLVQVKDSVLTLTSASELGRVSSSTPVDANEDFAICIDAKMITDMLSSIPEQPLIIEINAMAVKIGYHGGHFTLVGSDPNLFPEPRQLEQKGESTYTCADMLRGLNAVSFCATTDDLRPALSSVRVESGEGVTQFVSTDGQFMGLYTNNQSDINMSFTLPIQAAKILSNILPEDDTEIRIADFGRNIRFSFGQTTFQCLLVEDRYPNWKSVFPSSNLSMKVDSASIKAAISRVGASANVAGLAVLDITPEKLTVSCENIDYSTSAKEEVMCTSDAQDLTIGVNHQKLGLILSHMKDECTIAFSAPDKAMTISCDEAKLYLLMPMLVSR